MRCTLMHVTPRPFEVMGTGGYKKAAEEQSMLALSRVWHLLKVCE